MRLIPGAVTVVLAVSNPTSAFAYSGAVTTPQIIVFEGSLTPQKMAGNSVTLDPLKNRSIAAPEWIGDIFARIAAEVPESEWDKLPKDLSHNFDNHAYGSNG